MITILEKYNKTTKYVPVYEHDSVLSVFNDILNSKITNVLSDIVIYGDNHLVLDEISNIFKYNRLSFEQNNKKTIDIKLNEFYKINWRNTNIFKSLTSIEKFNL